MNIKELIYNAVEEYIDCMTECELSEIVSDNLDMSIVNRELGNQLEAHIESYIEEAVERYLDKNI